MGRSENWSDDLWIGEMGLSTRNGKRVDWRNKGGLEKNERIGVRNGKRKLTVSVDWIEAWIVSGSEWIGAIFVECLEWIGAWIVSGSEWIGAIFVECLEWIGACFVSGVEWIGALIVWTASVWSGSELGCVELGSWCVGVGGSVWLGVWVGAVKAWQRQCVCERLLRVREGRKSFEVKITTENDFSRFWLNFRSNWKHFQFYRILHNNQTSYFPENDFRKSISVKTNGA